MTDAARKKLAAAGLLAIGLAPAEFNWAYNPHLVNHPVVFWTIDVFRWTVLPAMVFWVGVSRRFFTPAEVGFHRQTFGRKHWLWFLFAMASVPQFLLEIDTTVNNIAQSISEQNFFPATFTYQQMMAAGPQSRWVHLGMAVYFAATAAVVEEFYYRGMIRWLVGRDETQSVLFVLISTALFCPPHIYGGSANVALAAVYGLVFSVLYLGVGNLWPIILGHFLLDLHAFN